MHDNLMLDDEYGGLLLEGKPTLFKNQSMNSSRSVGLGSSTLFSKSSSSVINNLSRTTQLNSQASGNFAPSTGSGVHPPSGYRPVQKQWIQSQPMSPRGDEGQSMNYHHLASGGSKMPQIQGHHEFNPKEASTLVIAEETPSFYN